MARPDAARRVKSYSAATGYVYQYYFFEVRPARRGFATGNEYIYMVSADRKSAFPVRIFVSSKAVREWGNAAGRPLTGTEEYAAAKMRLFQAFDEIEDFAARPADLIVDAANLDALLKKLDV
ncbi:MAG: hypothetical protein K6U09_11450 [Acidobacteriia bacterium]|jgi:hypothetical protein|nr:hypothetical protein [Terriglobia bacterium]